MSDSIKRPTRAIKRRRFSDDTYNEVPNMEAVFRSREIQDASSPSPTKVDRQAGHTDDSMPDNTALTSPPEKLNPSAVNMPTSGKRMKSTSKRLKNRANFMNTIWRSEDDLILIDSVIQTSDLLAVFASVKFSTHFTLTEIQERWESILYDSIISKYVHDRIKKMPIMIRRRVLSKAIFSDAEEQILCDINSNNLPCLDAFQAALVKHRNTFHVCRTAKTLRKHWLLLRRFNLLANQGVNNQASHESFPEVEERLREKVSENINKVQFTDPVIQNEIQLAEIRAHEEIKALETELPRWQFLLGQTTGTKMSDFDDCTYALLRGRSIRFLMQSRAISLGRNCKDNRVDVDLSLEGPSHKISRVQATITLLPSGTFAFMNQGKRPVFIDGKVVLPGNRKRLQDNSVIIICKVALLFLANNLLSTQMKEKFNEEVIKTSRSGYANTKKPASYNSNNAINSHHENSRNSNDAARGQ